MEQSKRKEAMSWFNSLTPEQKKEKVIKAKHALIASFPRNPDFLTGREIEIVYNFHNSKK